MRIAALALAAALLAACSMSSDPAAPIRLPNPLGPPCVSTGIYNGNFSLGLLCWGKTTVASGSIPGHPIITVFTTADVQGSCLQSLPAGTHFVNIDTPGNADAYVWQAFTVPQSATTLTFLTWGTIDPVTATISIVDASGNEAVLDRYTPPPVDSGSLGTCTGNTPVTKTYNISQFAGQTVTLRLRSTGPDTNNSMANFTNVSVQ